MNTKEEIENLLEDIDSWVESGSSLNPDDIKKCIQSLQAENERVIKQWQDLSKDHARLQYMATTNAARIKELEEGLRRYGRHFDCKYVLRSDKPCSCGLQSLLKDTKQKEDDKV